MTKLKSKDKRKLSVEIQRIENEETGPDCQRNFVAH